MSRTKTALAVGAVVFLVTTSIAQAQVTKTIDFNNQFALSQLQFENITFATAPWYQVNLNSHASPVVFTVQDNSNIGHYHIAYESPCMTCITSAGRFGRDPHCNNTATSTTCVNVDTTLQPRNVLPHDGPNSILISAKWTMPFSGNTVVRPFTVNSVQLENNTPVIFCGQSSSGILCTGRVSGPGTVNLSALGNVNWMEIHGIPGSAPYQFDNVVVTF